MANELVKFPGPGDAWEAVSGPGMYVLAVLPREAKPDECAIGCAITLLRPTGKLLTAVPPLWTTEESRTYEVDLIEEAAKLFDERGERTKAAIMRAQFPVTDLSVEVVQATHMGSVERTLRSRETGEYWQARWEDLTPAGVLHMHQINTAFLRSPQILTFLGEGE